MLENYKNENVLVTGGAGFVGSNVVKTLLELGAKVDILDDFFTGDVNNLKNISDYNLINGDVRDQKLIKDIIGKYSYIFHLAARNIIISTKDPKEDYSVNIGGTLNILDELRRNNKNIKKFIYSGSVSVYGNSKILPINEDCPTNVLSPYAVSKLGGENYTKIYHENYELPTTIVRYSNVYGENQSPTNPYCGAIGKFIEKINNNQNPIVHGDGNQTRDFTYIQDSVNATLLAGISEKSVGETFNVGSGIEISVNDIIKHINQIYEKNIEIDYVEKRDIDNIRRRFVTIEKIKNTLGWNPQYDIESGLKKTIEWYKNNI